MGLRNGSCLTRDYDDTAVNYTAIQGSRRPTFRMAVQLEDMPPLIQSSAPGLYTLSDTGHFPFSWGSEAELAWTGWA